MFYCPRCGRPVRDGARFCGECGAPIPARGEVAAASSERTPPQTSPAPTESRSRRAQQDQRPLAPLRTYLPTASPASTGDGDADRHAEPGDDEEANADSDRQVNAKVETVVTRGSDSEPDRSSDPTPVFTFCINCGFKLPDESLFCPGCGATVLRTTTDTEIRGTKS